MVLSFSEFRIMRSLALLVGWLTILILYSVAQASEIQTLPERARCPVCGMFVAKYPDWLAVVELQDGSRRYFDGAKDMFKFYLNPTRYEPDLKGSDTVSLSVKDYYGLNFIDARTAFFVTGSDVYGPMGHEFIPCKTRQGAIEFQKDHKGKKILLFHEINSAVIKGLDPF